MSLQDLELGPLTHLLGTWEGDKGADVAPSSTRKTEKTLYRERMVFAPTGRVDNHEQILYGLRYNTTAWRLGQPDPFHEELGYWLWDAKTSQVMRCFMVPRGVTVIAGGKVKADARSYKIAAKLGSPTYGICSNEFLHKEFRTVKYELKIIHHDATSFSYDENTQLKIKGTAKIFNHRDKNTLHKIT